MDVSDIASKIEGVVAFQKEKRGSTYYLHPTDRENIPSVKTILAAMKTLNLQMTECYNDDDQLSFAFVDDDRTIEVGFYYNIFDPVIKQMIVVEL